MAKTRAIIATQQQFRSEYQGLANRQKGEALRLMLALCIVVTGSSASGQDNRFLESLAVVSLCNGVTGPAAKDAMEACAELGQTIAVFQQDLGSTSGYMPAAYADNVRKEGKELSDIIQKRQVTEAQVANIRAITKDLNLKLDAHHRFVTTVNPFPKINVAAHTKSNSTEKSGYEVWWAYFSDRNNPTAYIKFSRDSSPATDQLYPGVYMMYRMSGQRKGPKIQISVDSASLPYEFDLPIPR